MNYVSYRRVSTKHQGHSGLGLAAQQTMIDAFVQRTEGALVSQFTEVESGTMDERPILWEAIEAARIANATLLVAKLDRLARSVGLINMLLTTKIPFIIIDMPEATPLTLHIMAAIAQHEAETIRSRIKVAMTELKKRGKKLGSANPKIAEKLVGKMGIYDRQPSIKRRFARIREEVAHLIPMVRALRSHNVAWIEITRTLNTYLPQRWSLRKVRKIFGKLIGEAVCRIDSVVVA